MAAQPQNTIIMLATYYAIFEYNQASQTRGEIVDEGIITNSEATICPGQNIGDTSILPSEVEAHHFQAEGYKIEMCQFTITRDKVIALRTTGDKITK